LLEGGTRTATVWTTTPVCVVVIPPDTVSESALEELALGGRREQQG
jgi:CRP-like cAMP-binding protein